MRWRSPKRADRRIEPPVRDAVRPHGSRRRALPADQLRGAIQDALEVPPEGMAQGCAGRERSPLRAAGPGGVHREGEGGEPPMSIQSRVQLIFPLIVTSVPTTGFEPIPRPRYSLIFGVFRVRGP